MDGVLVWRVVDGLFENILVRLFFMSSTPGADGKPAPIAPTLLLILLLRPLPRLVLWRILKLNEGIYNHIL